MSREVFCLKLQKIAPSLDKPPLPGIVGQRIFNHISKEGWLLWLRHQTQLINEHRLVVTSETSRQFLANQREIFLFGASQEKDHPTFP